MEVLRPSPEMRVSGGQFPQRNSPHRTQGNKPNTALGSHLRATGTSTDTAGNRTRKRYLFLGKLNPRQENCVHLTNQPTSTSRKGAEPSVKAQDANRDSEPLFNPHTGTKSKALPGPSQPLGTSGTQQPRRGCWKRLCSACERLGYSLLYWLGKVSAFFLIKDSSSAAAARPGAGTAPRTFPCGERFKLCSPGQPARSSPGQIHPG